MELRDRVAVVTGGAARIGRELSLTLARAGARICVHYGSSRDEAEQTATDIRNLGSDAVTVQADLFYPINAAETIFSAAIQTFGRVDVLINNAAIFEAGRLQETSAENWERHLRINLQSPVCLCQQFAEQLSSDGPGAIINIADWRAQRPQPGHLAYTISKAGIVCLTEILAQELAPRVRVNAIAPGAILPAPGMDRVTFERRSKQIPLLRTGEPVEIAQAMMSLLQNDFITGEVLHVTGGEQLPVASNNIALRE